MSAGPAHLYDERITIWRRTGASAGGDSVYGSPVTIDGRWMDGSKLVTGSDGEQVGSDSSIMVDLDLDLKDRAYRGTSVAADPLSVSAKEIIARRIAKRPHGGLTVRRYFLI